MAIHKQKHLSEENDRKEPINENIPVKKEIDEKPLIPIENHFRPINLSTPMSPENKVSGKKLLKIYSKLQHSKISTDIKTS